MTNDLTRTQTIAKGDHFNLRLSDVLPCPHQYWPLVFGSLFTLYLRAAPGSAGRSGLCSVQRLSRDIMSLGSIPALSFDRRVESSREIGS